MASSVLEALVRRQEDTEGDVPVTCGGGNEYDGRMGLRISAIFVILVGATLGAWFPVFARRKNLGLPEWTFFVAKFFGSGVIIATAFIHVSILPLATTLASTDLLRAAARPGRRGSPQ